MEESEGGEVDRESERGEVEESEGGEVEESEGERWRRVRGEKWIGRVECYGTCMRARGRKAHSCSNVEGHIHTLTNSTHHVLQQYGVHCLLQWAIQLGQVRGHWLPGNSERWWARRNHCHQIQLQSWL